MIRYSNKNRSHSPTVASPLDLMFVEMPFIDPLLSFLEMLPFYKKAIKTYCIYWSTVNKTLSTVGYLNKTLILHLHKLTIKHFEKYGITYLVQTAINICFSKCIRSYRYFSYRVNITGFCYF